MPFEASATTPHQHLNLVLLQRLVFQHPQSNHIHVHLDNINAAATDEAAKQD
jgi:hypothetical protein